MHGNYYVDLQYYFSNLFNPAEAILHIYYTHGIIIEIGPQKNGSKITRVGLFFLIR